MGTPDKETILVVDDEVVIRELLRSILAAEGYAVLTAADGAAGIERFRRENPALVLTDIRMPVCGGLEVLRAVKAADTGAEVIVLSGHSDQATAIECLRMGADDFFLKPLEDLDIFLHSVNRALAKRRLVLGNRRLLRLLEELADCGRQRDSIQGS